MARTIINKTETFTKKDMINSKNGTSLQEYAGDTAITVIAAAKIENVNESNGEVQYVSTVVTGDGNYLTSISNNVYETMDDLIDYMDELQEPAMIVVKKAKSKSGRDFLSMYIK